MKDSGSQAAPPAPPKQILCFEWWGRRCRLRARGLGQSLRRFLHCQRAARMCAIAGDLYLVFRVFAALAAVLCRLWYDAPACRMRTFVLLNSSHDYLPFLSTAKDNYF